MITNSIRNWILAIEAVNGNPCDGHTLKSILDQVKEYVGWQRKGPCRWGYRGYGYEGNISSDVGFDVTGIAFLLKGLIQSNSELIYGEYVEGEVLNSRLTSNFPEKIEKIEITLLGDGLKKTIQSFKKDMKWVNMS